MRTRLTDLLGIEHPVMLAGMGGVSYHRLVAAVSRGRRHRHARRVDDAARRAGRRDRRGARSSPPSRSASTCSPPLPGQVEAGIDDVIDGGARIFVAGLGVPRDVVDAAARRRNVLVGIMCGKVRHAVSAVASGCDFVVAQGTEAGGHTGTVATMALVPQVVDAVGDRVPVVAAGGLFDGRGLAAALALGADGVWIGTRFIATPEARAVNGYKDDAARHRRGRHGRRRAPTPARPCRVVRNEWTQHFEDHPDELAAVPAAGVGVGARRRQPPRRTRRHRRSTSTASSIPPARASARSTRSSRPASSCTASSPRPRRRWPASTASAAWSRDEHERPRRSDIVERRGPTTSCPALAATTSRIPNVSAAYDAEWDAHGHMDAAVAAGARVVRRPADRRARPSTSNASPGAPR